MDQQHDHQWLHDHGIPHDHGEGHTHGDGAYHGHTHSPEHIKRVSNRLARAIGH